MKPRIELHIEELRLHGFAPADRARIGAAFERELTRLLADGALATRFSSSQHVPSLPGVTFPADSPGARTPVSGARPDAVGAAVARAIHGRLSK